MCFSEKLSSGMWFSNRISLEVFGADRGLFHKVRAGAPSGKPHTLFLIPLNVPQNV
jgi:hypothetical protein